MMTVRNNPKEGEGKGKGKQTRDGTGKGFGDIERGDGFGLRDSKAEKRRSRAEDKEEILLKGKRRKEAKVMGKGNGSDGLLVMIQLIHPLTSLDVKHDDTRLNTDRNAMILVIGRDIDESLLQFDEKMRRIGRAEFVQLWDGVVHRSEDHLDDTTQVRGHRNGGCIRLEGATNEILRISKDINRFTIAESREIGFCEDRYDRSEVLESDCCESFVGCFDLSALLVDLNRFRERFEVEST